MAYWGNNDPLWLSLSGPQRAAAMALLEARVGQGGIDVNDARNALGAIINRAQKEGQPLGSHVSKSIYQPIIEDDQRSRLQDIVNSPEFNNLTNLAQKRVSGEIPDWVKGADHYLAPPQIMIDLYNKDPDKYHNWGPFPNTKGTPGENWTNYDPETGQYKNVVFSDNSHHFLNLLGDNPESPQSQIPIPPATASAPPATTGKKENPMLETLLASLFGGGSGGPTAALGGGQMTPLGQVGGSPAMGSSTGDNALGMLQPLFQNNQQNNAGPSLAQQAMQNASTGGGQQSNLLQRRPVDLSGLQALLAKKPMLGYGPGRLM